MNNNDIYFDLPIVLTKQKGFAKQFASNKSKGGDIIELPEDAVLIFPREAIGVEKK